MTDIYHLVDFEVPAEVLFEQLATIDGLATWWTEDTSGDPSEGGLIDFRWGDRYHHRMLVSELVSNRRVVWECQPGDAEEPWIGTRVIFDLDEHDGGQRTTLRFTHDQLEYDDGFARCNTIWSRLLGGLKYRCEIGQPSPVRWRPPPEA
jgi:uncharacterized protein YndB with AHSA1/START domain